MVCPQIIQHERLATKIFGTLPVGNLELFTDSRAVVPGGMFVALVGESFDAFNFIAAVADGGAQVIVCQNAIGRSEIVEGFTLQYPDCCFIIVEDSLKFLQQLAHAHLKNWKKSAGGKVLAITGSNGKTTYKNMLRNFLQSVVGDQLHATDGNFNNHIGVPLTIFGLTLDHRYLVIELGTNHPGEIELLCNIAMPDGGLITNIGNAHLEFFHSEENIFKEKSTLYHYVREKRGEMPFITCGDDPFLKKLSPFAGCRSWGEQNGEVRVTLGSDQQQVMLNLPDGVVVKLENEHIIGEHNFKNLAATFLMAVTIFPDKLEHLVQADSDFKPTVNRSSWIERDQRHYFLDAYNANPASMEIALRSFVTHCQQKGVEMDKIGAVLGDMNELGEGAPNFHRQIGELLSSLGVGLAIFVGRFAPDYQQGFGDGAHIYSSVKELAASWHKVICGPNYIIIKGSRSLQLESLIDIN